MGNTESNVTSGVKKQADTSSILIYKLVDLKGGGLLVELMKQAARTKQYAELDHAIKTKVEPSLYNKGEGKKIPIWKMVLLRNKDRPRHKLLPILKAMEDPTEFDINMDIPTPPEISKNEKMEYREVCWDLNERGAVGETILHLCLLNATSIHADLAKRLLKFYPKLINDIYIGDEYYGESVLHLAIVNEDPSMVKFLLDSGADYHERCVGNFMCAEDQKASRTDSLSHEWVNLQPETNYEGYVYWGEYPLTFAACLGQEECYRLMLARGADPNKQDTNGNTVLHMLVIFEKMSAFDTVYEVGADIDIKNVRNLTPLTLAANLARIEMFFHILNIEREIYWQIGSITCAAYPLSQIDTIDNTTGQISKTSALNLVVFGDKDEHLELMDGVLIDLLNAKWNCFVKFKFYRQFFQFTLYFLISVLCFTLRPGPVPQDETTISSDLEPTVENIIKPIPPYFDIDQSYPSNTTTSEMEEIAEGINLTTGHEAYLLNENKEKLNLNQSETQEDLSRDVVVHNNNMDNLSYYNNVSNDGKVEEEMVSRDSSIIDDDGCCMTSEAVPFIQVQSGKEEKAEKNNNITPEIKSAKRWWQKIVGKCRLLKIENYGDVIRISLEILLEGGAFLYLCAAFIEAGFLGLNMFIENLMTAPSRVMFLFSCLLMTTLPLLRFFCFEEIEDMIVVIIMLTTSPYFLFFCRGFKTVGPFVVMIYRMVIGDLLRFVIIYLVFVMGFSQAYYIIFLSFDNPNTPDEVDDSATNPMPHPIESIMAMFLTSLNTFSDYYGAFEKTKHGTVAKLCFVIYMVIVAILLVNMLIAMMGNTYQKIAETRNEWQRQWARIVLVVERGVSPKERLKKLMAYSQPMSDGRRALVLRLNQSEEDKEEMKEILEMKRSHIRNANKPKKS